MTKSTAKMMGITIETMIDSEGCIIASATDGRDTCYYDGDQYTDQSGATYPRADYHDEDMMSAARAAHDAATRA